jgi:hypothetical protein
MSFRIAVFRTKGTVLKHSKMSSMAKRNHCHVKKAQSGGLSVGGMQLEIISSTS